MTEWVVDKGDHPRRVVIMVTTGTALLHTMVAMLGLVDKGDQPRPTGRMRVGFQGRMPYARAKLATEGILPPAPRQAWKQI